LIDVLTRYFERFIRSQGVNPVVLDDFVGFFHSFYLDTGDYQQHSSRLLTWFEIVGKRADEMQTAAYQRFYLQSHVPLEYRWRLADETHQSGKLLTDVFQAIPRATDPSAAGSLATHVGPPERNDELFALTGARLDEIVPLRSLASTAKRLPWLLCTIAGGFLAALATGLFQIKPQHFITLALFIPAIVAIADTMVLQTTGMTMQVWRRRRPSVREMLYRLGKEVLAGVALGALAGAILCAVAMMWPGQTGLALCLGATATGSIVGAVAIGVAVPFLFGRTRWAGRIAAGPAVRVLAGVQALLLYTSLARWLFA
jgi:hypothetical protein